MMAIKTGCKAYIELYDYIVKKDLEGNLKKVANEVNDFIKEETLEKEYDYFD